MSSFDNLSSMTIQAEDFQYSPTNAYAPVSRSRDAPLVGGSIPRKRVRVILGGKSSTSLEARNSIGQLDATAVTTSLQKEFQRLCSLWKHETQSKSSLTDTAMHPAYQRIIGLGPAAMSLIMAELVREPDWWFWALRAITGTDPVSDEDRGRLGAMTTAWLNWWEGEGVAGRWKV